MAETNVPDQSSELDDLTKKLIGWYKEDIEAVTEWRKEAREDFKFYANDQWSDEDVNVLRQQNRPVMTFNRVAPLVNAVTGSEINNRREVRYIPREMGDAEANEILTSAGEWFRDQADAEDEESDAFQDTVISGMGWTSTRLDYECEPDGLPKVERLDPLKMVWDSRATKANLEDSERYFYVDEKPWSEVQEMFPKVPKEELHAAWASNLSTEQPDPHDQTQANLYTGTQNEFVDKYPRRLCTIVECRWLEREPYWRGPDIGNPGQMREYAEEQIQLIQKNVPGFKAVRQYRKVVRRVFIGTRVLAPPDSPQVPAGMVGWECITGFHDKIKRQFFGVVRPTKDPQRWSNKYFSQVMYLLNSKAKGGVMAEKDAFADPRQAEESWSKSDSITWLKSGSLGQNPKVVPKPESQFPAGFWTLFQEAKEAINDVTGLSAEFIGTREVDQPGVLEYQRKQSSLNLLAPLFNSLRRYRKRQGRIMLYLIQNFLSDGRLVRIVGQDRAQYVPLTKENIANIEYDIIVDDAPTSPNEKERTWQILMQLLPLIKDQVPPDMLLQLLKYSPLPASLIDLMIKIAQQKQAAAAQNPQPNPLQIKMQAELQKHQLDMQGKQVDIQAKQQSAQIDAQSQGIDLFYKQQQAALDQETARFQQEIDIRKLALQEQQAEAAAQRAQNQQTRAAKQ
ncbi:portal protein [Rhizobium sp. CNPSo 4062]|uniref:portal protein n=1 Tax=Rhizobium sp. CNPSo 4062 TaxID=3021410 RepID=UPI00254D9D4E|nr:portal protein [Rhizobium sp. CNPSo 4062]MDK4703891.1 portal protein [Rhizobium sp. CNPSo 4062]